MRRWKSLTKSEKDKKIASMYELLQWYLSPKTFEDITELMEGQTTHFENREQIRLLVLKDDNPCTKKIKEFFK